MRRLRGQAMVEFALIGVIFLLVILGSMQAFLWFSETARLRMALITAASEVAPLADDLVPHKRYGQHICVVANQPGLVTTITNALRGPLQSRAINFMSLTRISENPWVTVEATNNNSGTIRDLSLHIRGGYTTKGFFPMLMLDGVMPRMSADMPISTTVNYKLDIATSAPTCP